MDCEVLVPNPPQLAQLIQSRFHPFDGSRVGLRPAAPAQCLPDLLQVALSKAKPGTLSYGTFSFPLAHFMEKLKQETGADIVRIPFRSGSEVVNAVLSGSTPVAILALSMVPQLQSGHITGLVVTGRTRSPLFPDIPTLAEVRGGENYPATWFGLFAPAGTPKPIIAHLAHEVARIVDNRDFRQRMYIDRAVEPSGVRLEEFAPCGISIGVAAASSLLAWRLAVRTGSGHNTLHAEASAAPRRCPVRPERR
jgi:tripartite-type tricarboxylate transporter receptor subunit TctC